MILITLRDINVNKHTFNATITSLLLKSGSFSYITQLKVYFKRVWCSGHRMCFEPRLRSEITTRSTSSETNTSKLGQDVKLVKISTSHFCSIWPFNTDPLIRTHTILFLLYLHFIWSKNIFLFYLLFTLYIYINKNYVYSVRLNGTCHSIYILLLFPWFDCFYCPHL